LPFLPWPGWCDAAAYQPQPLETPPGTTYNYANAGDTLLLLIAARAAGLPFDELSGVKRWLADDPVPHRQWGQGSGRSTTACRMSG